MVPGKKNTLVENLASPNKSSEQPTKTQIVTKSKENNKEANVTNITLLDETGNIIPISKMESYKKISGNIFSNLRSNYVDPERQVLFMQDRKSVV